MANTSPQTHVSLPPFPLSAEDIDLIRRAELRATGAEIHRVANLCAAFRLRAGLTASVGAADTRSSELEKLRRELEIFVRTGELALHWHESKSPPA